MSQPVDSNPTPSATKLLNMWEQAIQKKKQQAHQTNKPLPKKQPAIPIQPLFLNKPNQQPNPPMNNQNNPQLIKVLPANLKAESIKIEVKSAQLPLNTKLGTNNEPPPQMSRIQSQPVQEKQNDQHPQPLIIQSNSNEKQTFSSTDSQPKPFVQTPLQTQIKPPPAAQCFYPPAGPLFVLPNQSTKSSSSASSNPPKLESNLNTPSKPEKFNLSSGSQVQQLSVKDRMRILEEQIKKNQSSHEKQPVKNIGINGRLTYQPQKQSSLLQTNQPPKQPQINLYDIIGPPSNIQTKGSQDNIIIPSKISNQIKPTSIELNRPIHQPSKPQGQLHKMTIKERMQMMKNTLQNNMKQKQKIETQPQTTKSPAIQPIQQIPRQEFISNEELEKPVRAKNKMRNVPKFDDI